MAKKTLRLLADSYDQVQEGHTPQAPRLKPIQKGELFTPLTEEEYDRLTESGAAVDPEREQDQRKAELERRRAEIEAEQARLDAELQGLTGAEKPLEKLNREQLNERARAVGVDDPEALENKDAVIEAIRAAEASQPPTP